MATTQDKQTKKKINDSVFVNVKSGFYGKLVYINHKSGDMTVWEKDGEIQEMSIADLKAMKAGQLAFFKNHWVFILDGYDDDGNTFTSKELINHLKVGQYYKDFTDPKDFAKICNSNINDIEEKVNMLSEGAKQNLVVALNTYIENGTLDSLKKIKEFERVLGCSLSLPE